MEISQKLAKAITDQIGHEFQASQQYLALAGYFREKELTLLYKIFMKQSNEEREHALKFVEYLWDTNNTVELPALPASYAGFKSSEEAVASALAWEKEVTLQDGPAGFCRHKKQTPLILRGIARYRR